jgi:hypothetical protein
MGAYNEPWVAGISGFWGLRGGLEGWESLGKHSLTAQRSGALQVATDKVRITKPEADNSKGSGRWAFIVCTIVRVVRRTIVRLI